MAVSYFLWVSLVMSLHVSNPLVYKTITYAVKDKYGKILILNSNKLVIDKQE